MKWNYLMFKLNNKNNKNNVEAYYYKKIKNKYCYLYKIPIKILYNFDFSIKIIKFVYFSDIYNNLYYYFPKEFFNNINFVIEAVKCDCNLINFVPDLLKYDIHIYFECYDYYINQSQNIYSKYYIYESTHEYFSYQTFIIDSIYNIIS